MNNPKLSIKHIALIILLVFQAGYASAEYIAETEIDHAGHLYIEGSYHSTHTDHLDHHDLESSDHEGHCHGQIHTYLSPSCAYIKLTHPRPNLASEKNIHYYSLYTTPRFRPPVQAISLT